MHKDKYQRAENGAHTTATVTYIINNKTSKKSINTKKVKHTPSPQVKLKYCANIHSYDL